MNNCDMVLITLGCSSTALIIVALIIQIRNGSRHNQDLVVSTYFMLLTVCASVAACAYGQSCRTMSRVMLGFGIALSLLDYMIILLKEFVQLPRLLLKIVDWRFSFILTLLLLSQAALCDTTVKPSTNPIIDPGQDSPDTIFYSISSGNAKMTNCSVKPSKTAFSSAIGAKTAYCIGASFNCLAQFQCLNGVTTGDCRCDHFESTDARLFNDYTADAETLSHDAVDAAVKKYGRSIGICGAYEPKQPAECGPMRLSVTSIAVGFFDTNGDSKLAPVQQIMIKDEIFLMDRPTTRNYTKAPYIWGGNAICSAPVSFASRILQIDGLPKSTLDQLPQVEVSKAEAACVSNPNVTLTYIKHEGQFFEMAFYVPVTVNGWSQPLIKGKRSLSSTDISWYCKYNEFYVFTPSDEKGQVVVTLSNSYVKTANGPSPWIFTMPRESLAKGLNVTLEVYLDGLNIQKYEYNAKCDPIEYCDTFNCYFCLSRMKNFKCIEWWQYIVLSVAAVIITILLSVVTWLCAICLHSCSCAHKNVNKARSYIRSLRSGEVKQTELKPLMNATSEMESGSNASSRRLKSSPIDPFVFALIMLLIPVAFAIDCSSTFSYSFKSDSCQSDGTTWTCHSDSFLEVLTVSRAKVCYLFQGPDGSTFNQSYFEIKRVYSVCSYEQLYWVAYPELKAYSAFNCYYASGCTDPACNAAETQGKNIEVDQLKGLPVSTYGRTGCYKTPSHLGCFYIGYPGCLFYRYNLNLKDTLTDKVVQCSSWLLMAEIVDSNGKTVNVLQGVPTDLSDGSTIVLESMASQQTPATTWQYLTSTNRQGLWRVEASARGQPVAGQLGSFQCSDQEGKNCVYSDKSCTVLDTSGVAFVKCAFPITDYNNPQIQLEDATIQAKDSRLEIDYYSSNSVKLTFKSDRVIKGPVKVTATLKQFTYVSMKGAINSLDSPQIKYTCETRTGGFIGVLKCSFLISIHCDTDAAEKTAYFRSHTANIKESCLFEYTDSTGRQQKSVTVSGTLNIDDLPDDQGGSSDSEDDSVTSDFWSELMGFFSLKWLWITAIVIALLIGITIVSRTLSLFTKKNA